MTAKDTDQLAEMRKRYNRAREFWSPLYDKADEDIKFVVVPGNQWDSKLKGRRGDRPCYEFPKLDSHCRQVINEMRQARPQGKVRGTEESDRGLAELMQGLCRNIESTSNAEQAYDIAYEPAVQGGLGFWRLCTDYLNDDDFEQDIRIKPIRNWRSVKLDPAAVEIDRRDGLFAFVEELIPDEEFERRFPKANKADFDADHECKNWRDAGQVRIAEYWYKQPEKRELWVVRSANGESTVNASELGLVEAELLAAGLEIVKRRTVDGHKVMMRLTNGHEFLTAPYEFPSKFIPIVPVWGNIQNIDGEDYFQGMVRKSKDQQRLHNVHRTATIEAVAKAPKAPFILKLKWIKGLEHFWNRANAEDYPYLPVADTAEDMPKRASQAEFPAALVQLAALDNEDMKATTGQYDSSLGARSNETSGRAINARKGQSATATFNYADNLIYAIKFTYEIMVDMIPKVYDTPRVVRVLGADGGEKWKQLYQEVTDPETGETHTLNDISKGKYDVTVTVGPTFATQRMEAVQAFTELGGQLGGSFPQLAPLMAYQVIKNMDLPGAEEIDTALRKMLVAQGMLPPKEGEQPPPPPPPDPRMEAQVRKLLADASKSEASAQKTSAEAQAVLPTAQAELQQIVADTMAQQLQNMAASGQLAMLMRPPPLPTPYPTQPPQGGFLLPEEAPQFTG